jgi:prolyl oligopeptidase
LNISRIIIGLIVLIMNSCIPKAANNPPMNSSDPYIWLEDIESDSALSWVKAQNDLTLNELQADPRFEQFASEALAIYEAKDRLIYGQIRGDYLYNFWRDDVHIRGIWRRSPLSAYLNNKPEWDVLLDIDALAEEENENWVYKASSGLPPDYNRFLLELSRGGKDAVVVREFDVSSHAFVDDGFIIPEEKSTVSWINIDHVFVATNFGPGSMTESGYPASVRVWTRGENLEVAPELARVGPDNVAVWGWTIFTQDGNYSLISKASNFWSHEILVMDKNLITQKLLLPHDAAFKGIWRNHAFALLRTDWRGSAKGSLIALNLETNEKNDVFIPDSISSILEIQFTSTNPLLTIQENVADRVFKVQLRDNAWVLDILDLPMGGTLSISSADPLNSNFFFTYNDLITPTTLGYFSEASANPVQIQQSPARYDSYNLEVNQKFVRSKDGTSIPYFLVSRKDIILNGSNPTLLYGYGGFEVSEKNQYWSKTGKLWMEKGGVFALANIRGGGEYGPVWHQAALKTNRHKSYEDFFAIAEDLIGTGITSPAKLGIMGGSGGGLLVGAAFTMRPDLFGAVVSQVPLLDMMRYHKLLAGASWMGEYGDPDDPNEGAYLRNHSPYHLLESGKNYPRALFTTSTKDDRVHPGHARKMVARMLEQGHPVMYYENMEGGHAAGANLKQYATMAAIEFTYLHRQLGLVAESSN